MQRRHLVQLAATAVAAPLLDAHAQAPAFPLKPIKLVIAFPAGGPTDVSMRVLAENASKILGQPVVVENKPGAGGNNGANEVAKSPADGYTLLMGTVGTHAINPALYARMPYDHVKDFVPVTLVAGVAILILSAASGYVAHEDGQGIDWLELSIYLCAVVVVATQGGRLLRACVGLAKRPVQWMRTRSGGGTDGK